MKVKAHSSFMNNQIKGLLYIILGAFLVVFVGGEFIIRVAIVIFGFYLIYFGLQLRNADKILFFIHRFRNRF